MSNYAYATLRHLALERYPPADLYSNHQPPRQQLSQKELQVNNQTIEEDTPDTNLAKVPIEEEPFGIHRKQNPFKINLRRYWAILALITYIVGLGSGYMIWGSSNAGNSPGGEKTASGEHDEMIALLDQINPPDGYELPIRYGDFAPKLVAAGVIDFAQFVKLYQEIGSPLSEQQIAILTKGSDDSIVIDKENQHFLLNLFWALGLADQNKILTDGPMMSNGKDQVVNFASTGGWTIASRPVVELYASLPILTLTNEQQKRLEEVAAGVYRPCCDNPTHFPDCNHGMAMLGLLELMASQGASVGEMFEAAKYVNAYWFPQQALELAVLLKTAKNVDFAQFDAPQVVGQQLFSGSGFQAVHQWLAQNGKLDQTPAGGGSCGVK